MSSVKKRRLCIVALVIAVCVSLGTVLMIRASAPVETKTVYLLPKPNPERAEILARALQPKRHAYATRVSDEAQAQDAREERSESSSSGSLSHDTEFNDAELESYLLGLEDETAEEKSEFPPVPDGYLDDNPKPIWLSVPGYQKGDMTDHENIARVLIKLWNQGERGFSGAVHDPDYDRVYPIYRDVVYFEWGDGSGEDNHGNLIEFKTFAITTTHGDVDLDLTEADFFNETWKEKYPDLKFIEFKDAGYNPYTFLTEND